MKWEYKISEFSIKDWETLETALNSFGQEKWELVYCFGDVLVFKRPVQNSLGKAYTNSLSIEERQLVEDALKNAG